MEMEWGVDSVRGHSYFLLFPLSLCPPPRSFLFSFIPRTLTYIPFIPFRSLSFPLPFRPLLSHPSHAR